MKLEEQVCSLELSKQLKKLGVKQESLYYWNEYDKEIILSQARDNCGGDDRWYSAFTVAELGEMLPEKVVIDNENYILQQPVRWRNRRLIQLVSYQTVGDKFGRKNIQDCKLIFGESRDADTEANARAKMLIYLLETNLIQ